MEELFKTVLSMSIGAGVFAAMVLIVRAVIGRRQTVVLTILFAVLIAKLIVPLSIESDASVFNLLPSSISQPIAAEKRIDADTTSVKIDNYVASSDSEPTLEHEKEAVQDATTVNEVVSDQPVNIVVNTVPDTVAPDKPAKPLSPWQIATIVWLCGMAALTVVITASNVAFMRKVNRNRTYTSPGFEELLRSCADELGVKQIIRAVQMSDITTVAVCGIFRPKLLVSPETFDKLTMQEKKNVLMHELSHIKRKDTLTCLIITVVNILHWFNPIVWAAFAVFRKDIEVMCDAKVLRKMDNAGRRSYANTLFTLAKNSGKTNTRFAMSLFMSKATIKRRIAMIAKYKKNSPLIIALALVLAVGIAVTGCTTPKTNVVESVSEVPQTTQQEIQEEVYIEPQEEVAQIEMDVDNGPGPPPPVGNVVGRFEIDFGYCAEDEDIVSNIIKAVNGISGTMISTGDVVRFFTKGFSLEDGFVEAPAISLEELSSMDFIRIREIADMKTTMQPGGGAELVLTAVYGAANQAGLSESIFDFSKALHNDYLPDVILRVRVDGHVIIAEYNTCEESQLELMSTYTYDFSNFCTEKAFSNVAKTISMLKAIELEPNEEVSLNEVVGDRAASSEWENSSEIEIMHNEHEAGMGACLVATSIYNAAIRAELKINEVTHHKINPPDIVDGLDATFSHAEGDLKIINPYDEKILIYTYFSDGNIVTCVFGTPLAYIVEYEVQSEALGVIPNPNINFNTTCLPNGEEIATDKGVIYTKGLPPSRTEVYKVKYDEKGNELERTLYDTVEYEGYPAQIYVNGDSYCHGYEVYLDIDIDEINNNGD